jgi:hypothetical protein
MNQTLYPGQKYDLTAHNRDLGAAKYAVSFEYLYDKKNFTVIFNLKKIVKETPWNFPSLACADAKKNWQLWNFDVVEVFYQCSEDNLSYKELEVTPTGFGLCLEITKPRVIYHTPLNWSFKHDTSYDDTSAVITLSIEEKQMPFRAGFYAHLGHEFYSLVQMPHGSADFHRPQDFLKLSTKEG